MSVNAWRIVWVMALYDAPVGTPEARHAYTVFRKLLLKNNFTQHQFSVYLRHCPTFAAADALINRLIPGIPEDAHVSFYLLTDKQYGMTREFFGRKKVKKRPSEPCQIALF